MFKEEEYFKIRKGEADEMSVRFHNHKLPFSLMNKIVLDLGGGGGIHAGLLGRECNKIYSIDTIDLFQKYGNNFISDLGERFKRNHEPFRKDNIEFRVDDAMSLSFDDNFFDFAFSFNSLEHIPEPYEALKEVSRCLKEGGLFYATFSPIWTSDRGNHFSQICPEPWGHLINTESFYEKLKKLGASNEELDEYKNAMNRKPFKYYKDLFETVNRLNFNVLALVFWKGGEENISHENFNYLISAGYSQDDLLTNGAYFIFEKKTH